MIKNVGVCTKNVIHNSTYLIFSKYFLHNGCITCIDLQPSLVQISLLYFVTHIGCGKDDKYMQNCRREQKRKVSLVRSKRRYGNNIKMHYRVQSVRQWTQYI
jgi:hypothetical protein